MTLLLSLLGRFWYVIPITVFAGAAGFYHTRYDRAVAAHAAYVTARDLADTRAVDAALAAQKAAADAAEAHNASILQALNDANAKALAARTDADFARRLLSKAAATAAGGQLPAAQGGQPADAASGRGGDQSLAAAVADAAADCRIAINRYVALQDELRPQL